MSSDELKQKTVINDGMKKLLWTLTIIGSLSGGLVTGIGILRAISAQANGELIEACAN